MREREIIFRLRLPAAPRQRWLVLGIALVVSLGAIVYAAVPNVFSSGDSLSSTKVNANFSNLDTRVTSLEGKTLGGWVKGFCSTASVMCVSSPACPAGQRAVLGACWPDYLNGGATPVRITASYPTGDGASGSSWACRWDQATTATIYWVCAP